MALIISILMALGFIHSERTEVNVDKFKNNDTYKQMYYKAGAVDLDQNPEAWAAIVKKFGK